MYVCFALRHRDGYEMASRAFVLFCISWVIFHGHEVDTGLEDIDRRLRDGTSRALRFAFPGSSSMVVG